MAVMRHSTELKSEVVDLLKGVRGAPTFAEAIVSATSADERAGGILLVGGSSSRDHVLRAAQAVLRWDQLASFWSHSAIIADWPDDTEKAIGIEVTALPWRSERQVPERNGVTLFPLRRYIDATEYPNLAFAAVSFEKPKLSKRKEGSKVPERKDVDFGDRLMEAIHDPNMDRIRFPFWNWLATWSAYAYSPHSLSNPVIQGIPHPGSALCEYVFEAAGLDLIPGATATNSCPELLWSNLLYWRKHIGQNVAKFKVFSLIRDPRCASRDTLPVTLDEDIAKRMV